MAKYIIIEDERLAYEEIRRMMQRLRPDYMLTGWATGVEQAVLQLASGGIDLMIVDIRLSDGLSFEIFERTAADIPVIFTTAYDEYALRAFKVNSIDYLLKPVEEQALETALCKFERNRLPRTATPELKRLEATYMTGIRKNRFLVRSGDTFRYVETSDIAFFYSEEKYVFLHLFSSRRYIVDYTLEQLETMLDEAGFFRVARNCIANIRAIGKVSRYFGGRLKIFFSPECPHEVIVSRDRTERVLQWIDDIRQTRPSHEKENDFVFRPADCCIIAAFHPYLFRAGTYAGKDWGRRIMGEFLDESALLYPYRVCGLSGGQVASKAISRPERHTNCIEYLADGTAGGTVCRCYQLCRRTVVCTSIQHRGQRIPYYVMEQPYRAFHRTVFL